MSKENKRMLSSEELSFFTGQVAVMLQSGIPLYESIEVLAENYKGTQHESAFKLIYEATDHGEQLAPAMEKSGIFPRYAVKMAGVGESTGKLEQVMESLSRHYAREDRLTASVKNALRYPALLLAIMAVVVIIINWKVLPLFRQVLVNLGAESANISRVTMRAGTIIGIVALVLVALMVALTVVTAVMIKRGKKGALVEMAARLFPSVSRRSSDSFSRVSAVATTSEGSSGVYKKVCQYGGSEAFLLRRISIRICTGSPVPVMLPASRTVFFLCFFSTESRFISRSPSSFLFRQKTLPVPGSLQKRS